MPEASIHCVCTSPPYWGLRDYGIEGQIGLEKTPEEYIVKMVQIFREVRRVLRSDGTLWLNLGDSYTSGNRPDRDSSLVSKTSGLTNRSAGMDRPKTPAGLKPKDLCGIPWRVALALQADGWWLRSDIIWHKPNPMPESVTDRPTKAHEYMFLLTKSAKYFYDADAIREKANPKTQRATIAPNVTEASGNTGGNKRTDFEKQRHTVSHRNKRTVWTIPTKPFPEAHFATFPPDLVEPCILAGCPKGEIVLDPFFGSGTTAMVAYKHDRKFIGIELSELYLKDSAIPRIEKETKQLKLWN